MVYKRPISFPDCVSTAQKNPLFSRDVIYVVMGSGQLFAIAITWKTKSFVRFLSFKKSRVGQTEDSQVSQLSKHGMPSINILGRTREESRGRGGAFKNKDDHARGPFFGMCRELLGPKTSGLNGNECVKQDSRLAGRRRHKGGQWRIVGGNDRRQVLQIKEKNRQGDRHAAKTMM